MLYEKKSFYIDELLVVITIIALLVSILMPALSRAKEQARIALCSSNLKQQGVAVMMYANGNNGNVPNYGRDGNWMLDLPFETTRLMDKYAGLKDNEVYVCPSNMEKPADDRRWWQYDYIRLNNVDRTATQPFFNEDELTTLQQRKVDYCRSMPYLYFFYRPTFDNPSFDGLGGTKVGRLATDWVRAGKDETWVSNIDRMKMAGEKPMIVDAVISNGPNPETASFFNLANGQDFIVPTSNHKSRRKNSSGLLVPSGGNHCYVDGHVSWVSFNEYHPQQMAQVYTVANYFGATNGFHFYWKYHHNYVGN